MLAKRLHSVERVIAYKYSRTPGTNLDSMVAFDRDSLLNLRRTEARIATSDGPSAARAAEMVTVVNEGATNGVAHGGGTGTLRVWREDNNLISELRGQSARPRRGEGMIAREARLLEFSKHHPGFGAGPDQACKGVWRWSR